MNIPIFTGTITGRKFILDDPQKFGKYLESLHGLPIEITVQKRRKNRSDHQNRYYWGVLIPELCNYFGYEKEEMHEALKWELLRKPANSHTMPDTVRSTADLTTKEFEEYLESIRRWASIRYQIVLPLPHETLEPA